MTNKPRVAILHYSAPPIIGGVEAVIRAHAEAFVQAGYPLTVIAGRGEQAALPEGAQLVCIPELDSQHPELLPINAALLEDRVPAAFHTFSERIEASLKPVLSEVDVLIVHNVFTKHFNLPLTTALARLLDEGVIKHGIAWCHDFSWTSPHAASQVHPGFPWDTLRTCLEGLTYVTVSEHRMRELAALFGCSHLDIRVVYNGVDADTLLGLSETGRGLIDRLQLFKADLLILMPVRITQAKNIEYAMQMLAALKQLDIDPHLVVTGPPDPHSPDSLEYFEELKALRSRLGVENEFHFVWEAGPQPGEPYTIDERVVGDLFRISDVVFMPSHREGFGMPILEAGLVGLPVVTTAAVPAALEIGGEDVILFDPEDNPERLAQEIMVWIEGRPLHRLRSRVRKNYTWRAIFHNQIEPLLKPGGALVFPVAASDSELANALMADEVAPVGVEGQEPVE